MPVNVYIGYYKEKMSLTLANGNKFNKSIQSLIVGGMNLTQLLFDPEKLEINQGSYSLTFKIAVKNSTKSGVTQLQFSHDLNNFYQQIAPLNIHIKNETLNIDSYEKEFIIPNGGKSLPIIIDFSDVMPINDLILTGLITDKENQEISYFTFLENQLILEAGNNNQTQLLFIVKGELPSSYDFSVSGEYQAKLTFKVDEINSQFYQFTSSIILKIVQNDQIQNPNLTLIRQTLATNDGFIQIKCSDPGQIYYILSQKNDTVVNTLTQTIKSFTQMQKIKITLIPNYFIDPTRTVYGYQITSIANNTLTFSFQNILESYAHYYSKFVCVNQMELESSPLYVEWKQKGNDGKPLKIQFEFMKTKLPYLQLSQIDKEVIYKYSKPAQLTNIQRVAVCCALSQLLQLETNKIFTSYGDSCQSYSTIKNATLRQLSSNELSSSSNIESYIIQSNLFFSDDQQNNEILKQLVQLDIDNINKYLFQQNEFAEELQELIVRSVNSSSTRAYPLIPEIVPVLVFENSNSYVNITVNITNNVDAFVIFGMSQNNQTTDFTPSTFLLENFTKPAEMDWWWHKFVQASKPEIISFVPLNIKNNSINSLYWIATTENIQQYNFVSEVKSIKNLVAYKQVQEAKNQAQVVKSLIILMIVFLLIKLF